MKDLKSLSFVGSKINDDLIEALRQIKLESLGFSDCDLRKLDLRKLSLLNGLSKITFDSCMLPIEKSVVSFNAIPDLKDLEVICTNFTPSDLKSLSKIPLKSLALVGVCYDLQERNFVEFEVFEPGSKLSESLEKLEIGYTNKAALKGINNLRKITNLGILGFDVDSEGIKCLLSLPKLSRLKMIACRITDKSFMDTVAKLNLTRIDMNLCTGVDAVPLSEKIKNGELRHVDLTGSWFSDPVVLEYGKYWSPLDTGRDFSRVLSRIVDPIISVLRDNVIRRTSIVSGSMEKQEVHKIQEGANKALEGTFYSIDIRKGGYRLPNGNGVSSLNINLKYSRRKGETTSNPLLQFAGLIEFVSHEKYIVPHPKTLLPAFYMKANRVFVHKR